MFAVKQKGAVSPGTYTPSGTRHDMITVGSNIETAGCFHD
jgi:hypothetical protein